MNKAELVLLYRFSEEKAGLVKRALGLLHIPCRILPDDAYAQKLGYLLGLKGYKEIKNTSPDAAFDFPHEVMIMQNIRNKRLDQVLETLRNQAVPTIAYKAVVTPFNVLWTLRRLCETMEKEHGAMLAAKKS